MGEPQNGSKWLVYNGKFYVLFKHIKMDDLGYLLISGKYVLGIFGEYQNPIVWGIRFSTREIILGNPLIYLMKYHSPHHIKPVHHLTSGSPDVPGNFPSPILS